MSRAAGISSAWRSGAGSIVVRSVAGQSAMVTAAACSPLKILSPRARGLSVWAYTSSFGGGLVSGDETRLKITVETGARCFLGTQASTKIYRNPRGKPCSHETLARVEPGALLVFAPDPVQPFADSSYTQRQEFQLGAGASLVLLDWFTAGRSACGERWKFRRLRTRNLVRTIADPAPEPALPAAPAMSTGPGARSSLTFLDSLALDADDGDGDVATAHRVGGHQCFATMLWLGPLVSDSAARVLAEVGRRPVARDPALLAAASPVRNGAVLRLAGREVEQVATEVRRHLAPLAALLGDDPWARKI